MRVSRLGDVCSFSHLRTLLEERDNAEANSAWLSWFLFLSLTTFLANVSYWVMFFLIRLILSGCAKNMDEPAVQKLKSLGSALKIRMPMST